MLIYQRLCVCITSSIWISGIYCASFQKLGDSKEVVAPSDFPRFPDKRAMQSARLTRTPGGHKVLHKIIGISWMIDLLIYWSIDVSSLLAKWMVQSWNDQNRSIGKYCICQARPFLALCCWYQQQQMLTPLNSISTICLFPSFSLAEEMSEFA